MAELKVISADEAARFLSAVAEGTGSSRVPAEVAGMVLARLGEVKRCMSCPGQVVVSSVNEGALKHCPTCGRDIYPVAMILKPGMVLGLDYEEVFDAVVKDEVRGE